MRQYVIATLVFLIATHAVADNYADASEKPNQGWFWYETPPVEVKKKTEKPPEAAKSEPVKTTAAPSEKKPMSAAWLREMLPKLRERAIDNPSKENLAAYFFAQRVEMDKAQRFSEKARDFVYSEPMLDENNRVPMGQAPKNDFMGKQFTSQEKALKYLAKEVGGLLVFFDSKCEFCKSQIKTINYLKEAYGFEVKYISMDGKGLPGIDKWERDNGHAKLLDLKVYPTTVFAVPPKTYLVVSQGMMAKDQLTERILTAATANKLLPDDMEKGINPFDRGVLTVDDMQDGASDNPDEFVKSIKEKLKKRY